MTREQLTTLIAERYEALVAGCPGPPNEHRCRLLYEAGFMAGLEHQLEVSREQFEGTIAALAGAER